MARIIQHDTAVCFSLARCNWSKYNPIRLHVTTQMHGGAVCLQRVWQHCNECKISHKAKPFWRIFTASLVNAIYYCHITIPITTDVVPAEALLMQCMSSNIGVYIVYENQDLAY